MAAENICPRAQLCDFEIFGCPESSKIKVRLHEGMCGERNVL
jgi:hypothetical protein